MLRVVPPVKPTQDLVKIMSLREVPLEIAVKLVRESVVGSLDYLPYLQRLRFKLRKQRDSFFTWPSKADRLTQEIDAIEFILAVMERILSLEKI